MRSRRVRLAAAGKYPGLVLFSDIFQATGPIMRTPQFAGESELYRGNS